MPVRAVGRAAAARGAERARRRAADASFSHYAPLTTYYVSGMFISRATDITNKTFRHIGSKKDGAWVDLSIF